LNIVVVVMATLPVNPWRMLFIPPHVALESAMACRVFRSLRLGLILETEGSIAQFSSQKPHFPAVMASTNGSRNSHHLPTVVEISKIVESTEPKSYPVCKQDTLHVHDHHDDPNEKREDDSDIIFDRV
jgi:hypothetical protein